MAPYFTLGVNLTLALMVPSEAVSGISPFMLESVIRETTARHNANVEQIRVHDIISKLYIAII